MVFRGGWLILLLLLGLAGCVSLPSGPAGGGAAAEPTEEALAAAAEAAAREAARPSNLCGPAQGEMFAYRKKVAVLAIPPQRPLEAADLPGIGGAWSQALQRELDGTGRFLLRDGSGYGLDPRGDVAQQIVDAAQRLDAQLVVAGRIVSLDRQSGRVEFGQAGAVRHPWREGRVIEVELSLYDGFSGALISRLNHHAEARGQVVNRGHRPLQGDFFQTPLGLAVAELLEQQREALLDEMACLPMMARIVGVQDEQVQIDAGFSSHLAPGDRLTLYQRRPGFGGVGAIEEAHGTAVVSQVFPETAVLQIEAVSWPDLRVNGVVRAW